MHILYRTVITQVNNCFIRFSNPNWKKKIFSFYRFPELVLSVVLFPDPAVNVLPRAECVAGWSDILNSAAWAWRQLCSLTLLSTFCLGQNAWPANQISWTRPRERGVSSVPWLCCPRSASGRMRCRLIRYPELGCVSVASALFPDSAPDRLPLLWRSCDSCCLAQNWSPPHSSPAWKEKMTVKTQRLGFYAIKNLVLSCCSQRSTPQS
jgi:hypothetical protein